MYKPKYSITDELLCKIAEIESYRTGVNSSYILPEREIELRYRASVEATHGSTSIEGNPLNLKQVEKVLSSDKQLTRHRYAEIEVKNYKKALDLVNKYKDEKKPISIKDILAIHKIVTKDLLPKEKVGIWRKNPIYIADQDDNTLYDGPDVNILDTEMEELLKWLNGANNIHPVIAAAILHFHFVSIHPIADGNGRITRLITDLYLGLRDYDFRGSLVLDTYYSVDKPAYYNTLHKVQGFKYSTAKNANLNSWIDYFVDGFLSAAKILSAEVTVLSSVANSAKRIKLSKDEADILSYTKQFGSITLVEAQDILINIPKRTIQRRLIKLVDDGYLTIEGKARDTRYVWQEKRDK